MVKFEEASFSFPMGLLGLMAELDLLGLMAELGDSGTVRALPANRALSLPLPSWLSQLPLRMREVSMAVSRFSHFFFVSSRRSTGYSRTQPSRVATGKNTTQL